MKKIARVSIIIGLIGTLFYVMLSNIVLQKDADASVDAFSLMTTSGEKTTLKLEGSIIVNFWATYCPPCEREMPAFEAAYPHLQGNGVELYVINVEEPTKLVNQFLSKFKLSFPVLLDRDGVMKDQYQIVALPTTLFIKDGEVVHVVKGEITEEQLLSNAQKIVD